jgi:hypothetical protein
VRNSPHRGNGGYHVFSRRDIETEYSTPECDSQRTEARGQNTEEKAEVRIQNTYLKPGQRKLFFIFILQFHIFYDIIILSKEAIAEVHLL